MNHLVFGMRTVFTDLLQMICHLFAIWCKRNRGANSPFHRITMQKIAGNKNVHVIFAIKYDPNIRKKSRPLYLTWVVSTLSLYTRSWINHVRCFAGKCWKLKKCWLLFVFAVRCFAFHIFVVAAIFSVVWFDNITNGIYKKSTSTHVLFTLSIQFWLAASKI